MSKARKNDYDNLKRVIATDCGSTTTKAILIEKKKDGYRLVARGEAPTTVEAPFEDVTRGVLNAIREVEELTGIEILDGENIITDYSEKRGVDIYVSTSSAGGGLQMMVAGVVLTMTGESAQRAALGAGAIVMDIIASNDGRMPHEKIERIRTLRPDMILLSGGIDGGTISHVAELAELIKAADPKPRFGSGYSLPVIYAGNKDAREVVLKTLEENTDLVVVENIRPTLERENLGPARHKIHELFMEHVMAHAPGYKKLMSWTGVPIMPTPGAVGMLIENIGKEEKIDVLGVDIGGATTDVFSVFEGVFNRTVSANLGMSYSISNVLVEAGIENIMRWLPFEIDKGIIKNRIRNKMIRPTTIPATLEDLKLEQAVAREALRLAFVQHKDMAVGLKGTQVKRTIADAFSQVSGSESLVNMMSLSMIVGSGGILSHAPRRQQTALMMLDAFQPEGFTELAVDSIFMMPHLGVLSTVNNKAAREVFDKDCLIRIGMSIAPKGSAKPGAKVARYSIKKDNGEIIEDSILFGELRVYHLKLNESAEVTIYPEKGFDVGAGKGKEVHKKVHGGTVGIIIDGRGRPLQLAENDKERREQLNSWFTAMDIYPRIN